MVNIKQAQIRMPKILKPRDISIPFYKYSCINNESIIFSF